MKSAASAAMTTQNPGVNLQVPVRHIDFQFDAKDLDPKMYRNTEFASAIFEALSIFLTFGEDLVIDTARYHRQFVKDPEMKQRLTALIGQEAIHSKMHNEFNDQLAKHRFPVPLYRFLADKVFEYGLKRLPNRMQLSLMAGIEHFTAVVAEGFYPDPTDTSEKTDNGRKECSCRSEGSTARSSSGRRSSSHVSLT